MPFPSTGCQTCKKRRIKCDGVQPICQRCLTSQLTCYGMTGGRSYSVFHIENCYASGQKKRPRGPRSTPTGQLIGNPGAGLHHPLVDLRTQAIVYYLRFHLQTLPDIPNIWMGVSDAFLPIWTSRADCPILDLAVSSMALAVFSRTQRHPPAAMEASVNYQRLLQILQVNISSLDKRNFEACLLAVFFMGRYENVVHRPSHPSEGTSFGATLQGFSHHDGALAMLKMWKHHLSHGHPPTDVIQLTRRGMIRSAVLRNLAIPDWMVEGASFGEHGLELEYDCIIVQIANLRQRLSALLSENKGAHQTSPELISTAVELNKEAQDIDEALQNWTAHFPSLWCYERHNVSITHPWSIGYLYSPIVHSYSSPAYATIWNQYFATRMLINSTRLWILEVVSRSSHDSPHEQRLECLSHINLMSNNLASSVPFCLQRVTVENPASSANQTSIALNMNADTKPFMAGLVAWPLTIASSLREADVKQKSWFRSALATVGRTTGDTVLEYAETDQWLEL